MHPAPPDPTAALPTPLLLPPTGRPLCARCTRPLASCLCTWVRPTANQVPLLILQHPQEARQAKGSARLLQLSLARCRCETGESFSDAALDGWLGPPGETVQPLLLYPDEGSASGADVPPPPTALPLLNPERLRLVLVDGTWRQSRQLLRQHPRLQALPRWALTATPRSRYAIRRAHRPGQLSTLEAACLALGTLEGHAARYAPLLASFDSWVAAVAARMPTTTEGRARGQP